MPTFAYTARDNSGAACAGVLDASSIAEVSSLLRNDGKYPTGISPARAGANGAASSQAAPIARAGVRISRTDVIAMSNQIAIMLETGVTITESLECIAAQADKPAMKKLLADLIQQVKGGTDFSAALQRHPRSFPRLYVALIKASEKSGMMSKLLGRATAYLRDEQDIVRKVRGAVTYPAIMLAFALSTTTFLLTFVMPKFTAIYASKGAALPTPTRILMAISSTLVGHWALVILGVMSLSAVGFFGFRTPRGRRIFDFLQIRVPVIGQMFRMLHLARSLRMIGTMAAAGVPLTDCVATAYELCNNSYYRALWTEALNQIHSGKQLSEPMFRSSLVPRSISQMLAVGEKSGKLAMVMEQVAGFSESELKEKITELTRYIEPAMIVVMGFIIGGVALALMLPIFQISRVVAK